MEDDLESSATADDHAAVDQAESDAAETVDVAADVNASDEGVTSTTDESAAPPDAGLPDDSGDHETDTDPSVLPLCP